MHKTVFIQSGMPVQSSASTVVPLLRQHWDIVVISLLLALSNRSLLNGCVNSDLIYHPLAVGAGEWWRLLSYSLVHISWYHLLLDAGAFYLLYTGLEEKRNLQKGLLLMICSSASLMFAVYFGTAQEFGLAGLSGLDHGLMAFYALEMMRSDRHRKLGLFCIALVLAKSIFELVTGEVFFAALHHDLCGIPVAASHMGGVLAGMVSFWVLGREFPFKAWT